MQFPALPEGGTNFTVIVLYLSEWCLCTCSQTGHSTHIVVSQLKTTVASPLVFDVCHVATVTSGLGSLCSTAQVYRELQTEMGL